MNIKKYLAELIGTFVLVVFGCGSAIFSAGEGLHNMDLLAVAFAFGLSVVVMAYTIGGISGCHINPAVTFAMLLSGKISVIDTCGYIIAQVVGAIAGGGVLKALVSISGVTDATGGLGSNGVAGAGGIGGAFIVEIILTFVFIITILGVTSSDKFEKPAGLVIGLSLVLVHILGINLTGTSVNPARSIGPAIFAGGTALSDVWVFIVAPLVGSALAVVIWKIIDNSKKAAQK